MADFNQPALTSLYADMVNVLKDRDISALKWLDGTTDSNIPSGAKRWNATNSYFEKFNGSTWSVLTAKYMIDVDKVDGCTVNDLGTSTTDLWTASKVNTALSTKLDASAYTAADVLTKIKTVDGSASGLDADLLDGLHASSSNTGSTVVSRDTSGNFSAGTITANLTGTASTASTLTGLTSTVAELNFSDGVTSNIQTQLNGKLGSTAKAADSALLNGVAEATTATANTIVKRDASGYIYATAFNSTLADTATAATHYYVETGSDGYLRPKTLANVKAEITTGLAPLASPAFNGTPTAPTPTAGDNSTKIATTAFVSNINIFAAGSKVEAVSPAVVNINSVTPAKVKEISVANSGTITVSFGLLAGSTSYTSYARVYKNEVAVGTLRSSTNSTTYTFYSENISVSLGDLIQLYIYASQKNICYAKDFKILVSNPTTSVVLI